jgi:hypothetical protein
MPAGGAFVPKAKIVPFNSLTTFLKIKGVQGYYATSDRSIDGMCAANLVGHV